MSPHSGEHVPERPLSREEQVQKEKKGVGQWVERQFLRYALPWMPGGMMAFPPAEEGSEEQPKTDQKEKTTVVPHEPSELITEEGRKAVWKRQEEYFAKYGATPEEKWRAFVDLREYPLLQHTYIPSVQSVLGGIAKKLDENAMTPDDLITAQKEIHRLLYEHQTAYKELNHEIGRQYSDIEDVTYAFGHIGAHFFSNAYNLLGKLEKEDLREASARNTNAEILRTFPKSEKIVIQNEHYRSFIDKEDIYRSFAFTADSVRRRYGSDVFNNQTDLREILYRTCSRARRISGIQNSDANTFKAEIRVSDDLAKQPIPFESFVEQYTAELIAGVFNANPAGVRVVVEVSIDSRKENPSLLIQVSHEGVPAERGAPFGKIQETLRSEWFGKGDLSAEQRPTAGKPEQSISVTTLRVPLPLELRALTSSQMKLLEHGFNRPWGRLEVALKEEGIELDENDLTKKQNAPARAVVDAARFASPDGQKAVLQKAGFTEKQMNIVLTHFKSIGITDKNAVAQTVSDEKNIAKEIEKSTAESRELPEVKNDLLKAEHVAYAHRWQQEANPEGKPIVGISIVGGPDISITPIHTLNARVTYILDRTLPDMAVLRSWLTEGKRKTLEKMSEEGYCMKRRNEGHWSSLNVLQFTIEQLIAYELIQMKAEEIEVTELKTENGKTCTRIDFRHLGKSRTIVYGEQDVAKRQWDVQLPDVKLAEGYTVSAKDADAGIVKCAGDLMEPPQSASLLGNLLARVKPGGTVLYSRSDTPSESTLHQQLAEAFFRGEGCTPISISPEWLKPALEYGKPDLEYRRYGIELFAVRKPNISATPPTEQKTDEAKPEKAPSVELPSRESRLEQDFLKRMSEKVFNAFRATPGIGNKISVQHSITGVGEKKTIEIRHLDAQMKVLSSTTWTLPTTPGDHVLPLATITFRDDIQGIDRARIAGELCLFLETVAVKIGYERTLIQWKKTHRNPSARTEIYSDASMHSQPGHRKTMPGGYVFQIHTPDGMVTEGAGVRMLEKGRTDLLELESIQAALSTLQGQKKKSEAEAVGKDWGVTVHCDNFKARQILAAEFGENTYAGLEAKVVKVTNGTDLHDQCHARANEMKELSMQLSGISEGGHIAQARDAGVKEMLADIQATAKQLKGKPVGDAAREKALDALQKQFEVLAYSYDAIPLHVRRLFVCALVGKDTLPWEQTVSIEGGGKTELVTGEAYFARLHHMRFRGMDYENRAAQDPQVAGMRTLLLQLGIDVDTAQIAADAAVRLGLLGATLSAMQRGTVREVLKLVEAERGKPEGQRDFEDVLSKIRELLVSVKDANGRAVFPPRKIEQLILEQRAFGSEIQRVAAEEIVSIEGLAREKQAEAVLEDPAIIFRFANPETIARIANELQVTVRVGENFRETQQNIYNTARGRR